MITYKSNGVNAQYTGGAVVIKDAADALHFFEASGEKTIGISGPLRVAADAGTATYTVTGAGSLGSIFTWSVEGGGGLTWSISSGGVLTIPSGVAAGTTASIMLKFGDMIVAGQQIVIEAAAPTAYTLSISATNATVTVTRGGTPITAGTAIYAGDVLTISADAENGYQNPTISVNGSTFTSGSTHTVSSNVTISATAEAVPDEPSGGNAMTMTVTLGNGSTDKTQGICFEIRNYAVGDKLSKHQPSQSDYQTTKTWNADSVTGTAGSGRPSVKIVKGGETWYETGAENSNYDAESYRTASENGSVGYATLFIHQTTTANQFIGTYTVTLTWA